MKILFLDIDGVLNSRQFIRENWHTKPPANIVMNRVLDPKAIERINRLGHLSVHVVVSSMWRWNEDTPAHLKANGLTLPLHTDWRTARNGHSRGYQIRHWLGDHKDVTTFAIVDDEVEEIISFPMLRNRTVKTNMEIGLQDPHLEALWMLLK